MKTDIQIESFKPRDLEKISSLQPNDWPDISPSLKFYCKSNYCFPIKATVGNEMTGIGTAIIYGDTAWLAHIIVNKEYRNAGIGSTITKALIDLVSKTSCETILLIATAWGEPVYKKFGFEVQTKYIFFDEGSIPSPSSSSTIKAFETSYQAEILKLDYRVSGEDRIKLLLPHLTNAMVFIEGESITGFYIPTLGEGLIIAENPIAGFELMKLRAASQKKFCIPVDNEHGKKILESYGCNENRRASRMIYGKKIPFDGTKIYNRIGGNLG